jgi:hypothetical protein
MGLSALIIISIGVKDHQEKLDRTRRFIIYNDSSIRQYAGARFQDFVGET